jgi:hypothetical protein
MPACVNKFEFGYLNRNLMAPKSHAFTLTSTAICAQRTIPAVCAEESEFICLGKQA